MALITETWQGDVLVIRIEESPLIDAKTIQQFQNELLATLEKTTASQVLLDFGQVKSMSSAALGALVRANRKCKERRMALKLINLCALRPRSVPNHRIGQGVAHVRTR